MVIDSGKCGCVISETFIIPETLCLSQFLAISDISMILFYNCSYIM